MVYRPKENLRLRKIGKQYIIVDARDGRSEMSDVFSLNETAAGMWQRMEQGECSVEQLADWMCSEYDVERKVAVADIERQLEDWKGHGLIVEA